MRYPSLLFLVLTLFYGCSSPTPEASSKPTPPTGPYFGLTPEAAPKMLFPDFISTRFGEYNGTFNADGSEFVYTISIPQYDVIVSTQLQANNEWSQPSIASFSGKNTEFDPLFSPDGKRLYFSSYRPLSDTSKSNGVNIWYVEKEGQAWGQPVHVPIKGSDQSKYFSSTTKNGNIYFNIWATGNLFKAIPSDTGYVAQSLGDVVNSNNGDGDPFVSPDEDYLIFRSYRNGGLGDGDFYISFQIDEQWTTPENLGAPFNSKYNEMCPYVTTDGKLFIFASNRLQQDYYEQPPADLAAAARKYDSFDNGQQNIYAVSADFIGKMRKKHE